MRATIPSSHLQPGTHGEKPGISRHPLVLNLIPRLLHESLLTPIQSLIPRFCGLSGPALKFTSPQKQKKAPLLSTQLPPENQAKSPHGSEFCGWSG